MEETIEVTYKVTRSYKDISYLLCNALEGGINYWGRVSPGKFPLKENGKSKTKKDYEYWHLELVLDGGTMIVKDIEEYYDDVELTREMLLNAVQKMADEYPRHFHDWIEENDDAITGDVFFQLACYGEVHFG